MINDLRSAFRTLLRNPGFTPLRSSRWLSGIGANTALFSVADAVLFKPLPYPDPTDREDRVRRRWPSPRPASPRRAQMEESQVFAGAGIYISGGMNVGGEPPCRTGSRRGRVGRLLPGDGHAADPSAVPSPMRSRPCQCASR